MKAVFIRFGLLVLSLSTTTARGESRQSQEKTVPTKQVMGELFEALQTVLPYSLSLQKFDDPAVRDKLSSSLKTLAEKASILPHHTEFQDATFKYLGGSLARDAKEISRKFDRGSRREALSTLEFLTDNCFACHSRLPSQNSMKAEALFKGIDSATVPLEEKARLYLVTRQFDKSMQAYKEIILSPDYRGDQIALYDWIGDYLLIAIRVKRDFKDVQDTLTKFLARTDLPLYARRDAEAWNASALQFSKLKSLQPNLSTIRKLIAQGQQKALFPMDRQGLVHYLLASGLLHEFVQTNPKGATAAEAYLLLGQTESMTVRLHWLAQNQYYLETAIRSAPGTKFAEKAFEQLEESVFFENTGSGGTDIPEEVAQHLSELNELIAAARRKGVKN